MDKCPLGLTSGVGVVCMGDTCQRGVCMAAMWQRGGAHISGCVSSRFACVGLELRARLLWCGCATTYGSNRVETRIRRRFYFKLIARVPNYYDVGVAAILYTWVLVSSYSRGRVYLIRILIE